MQEKCAWGRRVRAVYEPCKKRVRGVQEACKRRKLAFVASAIAVANVGPVPEDLAHTTRLASALGIIGAHLSNLIH